MSDFYAATQAGYLEVTVLVDGGVWEEQTFHYQIPTHFAAPRNVAGLKEFIEGHEREALEDGLPTEVFIQWHDHSPDVEECACSQYVQDGRPAYSWNMEVPE